ncbi:MAG: FtsX-like permease family protein [Ekhidna sp.]
MDKSAPPKILLRFFRWFCHQDLLKYVEGDLIELFHYNSKRKGKRAAKWLFAWEIVKLMRPSLVKNLEGFQKLNYYGMLKNYFITSFRFIKRERTFAFMNIAGLALGIACAIVIYKILDHELGYNKQNVNYDRIYRLINEDVRTEGTVYRRGQTHPLAHALRTEFPSINAAMTFYDKDGLIGIEDVEGNIQRFQEKEGVVFVESQYLELFTLPFLHGDASSALDQPGKVIITRSKAKKYFGVSEYNLHEAVGRSLILENKQTVFVSAIVENPPTNTDFPFEVIFHYQDQGAANPWFYGGKEWGEYNSATNCWVMLQEGASHIELEKQLVAFVDKYLPEHVAEKRTYRLQALSDLHYSSLIRRTYAGITSTKNELLALGMVGLFLIITACINFVNLSTAQAVKRSKEVGVRKTMGSSRRQLIIQFLCETFLITFFATMVGVLIASFLIQQVEMIFSYQLSFNVFRDLDIMYFLGLVVLGVTVVAGLYPSFVLAKMDPVLAIKNSLNIKQTSGFLSLRRILVIFQFAISQMLIIGILILTAQVDYFMNKDLGFTAESIVTVKLPENDSTKQIVLRNELLSNSEIKDVSFSTSGPMSSWQSSNTIFHPNIEGQDQIGNLKNVDENYFALYEIDIIAGEPFNDTDPSDHAVINRKLTQVLGFEDPAEAIGERLRFGRGSLEFLVVGVAEDFHSSSLRADMENVFLANQSWNIFQMGVKLNTEKAGREEMQRTIQFIEEKWKSHFPEHVFELEFYNEKLDSFYSLEQSVAQVFRIFMIIAIVIGALGLYGLVAFMANQKTKEIGIRKVMGASELTIWNIFSREFLTLLIVAFAISAPASYFLMNAVLDNYAYRVPIGPGFFVLSILASIAIALLTVGYKSLKVARANPILSLRDE